MILHNECISKVVASLEPEAFSSETNRLIYETVCKAYESKSLVDLVVLKDSIPPEKLAAIGGVERVASYADVPNPENWRAYLKVVEEKWRLREAYVKAEEIRRLVLAGGPVETAWKLADEIKSVRRISETGFKLSESVKSSRESLVELRKSGVDLYTGLKGLDNLVGGIRRRMLYVIGAKTSNGKTSFACNVAYNVLKTNPKAKVLINVFENAEQIPVRMSSILSGIPLNHYLKPDQCTEDEFELVKESLVALDEQNDRVVIMHGASVMQMRAMCDEFKPDVVIVDYIQRYAHKFALSSEDRLSHAIGKVASDLQDLAIEKNCAMFVLSQLSRRQEDQRNRKPTITDLKESGDLENYADGVWLLWWPWRDNPNGKNANEFIVVVAKNKLGPCEDKMVHIDVQTLKVKDW